MLQVNDVLAFLLLTELSIFLFVEVQREVVVLTFSCFVDLLVVILLVYFEFVAVFVVP